jgi:hypothetical protein
MRLLKKLPPVPGLPGFDLAGRKTDPEPPKDLTLRFLAGKARKPRCSRTASTWSPRAKASSAWMRSQPDLHHRQDRQPGRRQRPHHRQPATGRRYEELATCRSSATSPAAIYGARRRVWQYHSRGGTVVLDKNLVSGSVHAAGGIKSLAWLPTR